ncbi:TonB-dependent receptor plug domain-containing protein [Chitinophaga nivalis]|uniref:TonB-dependent receptor n=1 Tax=Chitinophaga nivalis TaxID=2991709 RepID=A0ABT3IWB6_9BACT|nr:TonB-dependent receptor [Chitinophaga nivalis]MCW3462040.1 TonB-dependent receptor [Chitinophaga nivalis]MCW3488268.1 TonB-dependent receptor [Chitinophaga nivalis]
MHLKLYPALCLCLGLATAATAQDSSRISQLNGVTVTATKGPQKASETGKVVTILSRAYLEKNSGKTIAVILNEQAGLIINGAENTRGTIPGIYMRGASTENALVLIDGLPVNDASQISSSFDLNAITPDQVEKIEILRGSQSTLYGSNAVAGVINIITRQAGSKPFGLTANMGYGSYNDYQGGLSIHGRARRFSYLLGYKYEKTDGFSDAYDSTGKAGFDKDGFRQHSLFAKLGLQATSRWNLQYLFSMSDYHHALDDHNYTDDKDYNGQYKYLLNGISSKYTFNKGSWHVLYNYQRNKRNVRNDSTDVAPMTYAKYDETLFASQTHQLETYVNWDVTKEVRLIAGGVFTTSRIEQQNLTLSPRPGSQFVTNGISPDSSHASQISGYATMLLHPGNGFNLELGGRFNYHNLYGNNQTISINPSYLINQQHKVFINIASAYKIPSLYQLYVAGYGNRNLLPESTISYEAGYQASFRQPRLDLRITGFARDTRDLIIFYYDGATGYSQYRNADKQRAYGAELEATWNITSGLDLTMNYTFVDGRITQQLANNKDTSYYNLYRVPKHALHATLGYQVTPALYTSVTARYIGQRYETRTPMGDYYTLDWYGEYKFGNLLKIFTGLRNITNYQYFDVLGFNTRRFNFNTGIIFNL